jgi:hypothetical protein
LGDKRTVVVAYPVEQATAQADQGDLAAEKTR